MEQMIHQFHTWWEKASVRKNRAKVGIAGSLLLFGWLSGTLLTGVLNQPSDLNAAISQGNSGASSLSRDGNPNPGFSDVAKVVRPAVVHITVVKERADGLQNEPYGSMREFFNLPNPPEDYKQPPSMGMGSGVIISPNGYVVTNHHVIGDATWVKVTLLDKREFQGKVVGGDPQTDLAVVKVEGTNLPSLSWGNSSNLEIGDYVLAVGHPFGLTATVTQGIVSALGRGGMGITQYEDFIQTDAAINPGNSGGALVNVRGELVGINTAILSRTGGYQGVGFAVPSDMAKPVFVSLRDNGKVIRGFLGVGIQALTPDLAASFELDQSRGALVTDVKEGSPADNAGIKRGDVIVQFQGTPIEDPRALQREVIGTPIGSSVAILVVREGKERELRTMIAEHPSTLQVAKLHDGLEEHGLAGIKVEPVNAHTAKMFGIENSSQGVVVTAVAPGSPADQAGLARGDVIREVNKQSIQSLEDYQLSVDSLKKNEVARIFIHRSGVPLFLTIKT